MAASIYRNEGVKERLLFILTLWTALGVALLSALAPLGPPSSRLTGSAFNPATTAVVLKARAHAAPTIQQAQEPDDAVPGLLWMLPVAPLILASLTVQRMAAVLNASVLRRPFHHLSHRHARAPPALS
jgi:hypothetical protein